MSAGLAPRGITVNSIAPSKIRKPRCCGQSLGEEGQKEELLSRIPVRRFGKPREIAALALFLASEEAGYITGETIVASGGYRIGGFPKTRVCALIPENAMIVPRTTERRIR